MCAFKSADNNLPVQPVSENRTAVLSLSEALDFIAGTSWLGSKPGLSRIEALLHALGDPQKHLKFIHVAGTNGKGSVCSMLASILHKAGYKAGLYTSPHLIRVNERFNINGEEISDEALAAVATRVKLAVDSLTEAPTEFEVITAMAFCYFEEQACDVVVLEVGLGGRLDATNVIPCPEAAVIMNIGLEHTEYLGDTLEKIAAEKAGIIKDGATVIAYDVSPSVTAVYEDICAKHHAKLHLVTFDGLHILKSSLDSQEFLLGEDGPYTLALTGTHQTRNAAVVLRTVACLREKGWNISGKAVHEGLSAVRWPARLEVLSREPLIILDGAHNPQCAQTLADSLGSLFPHQKAVFVAGVLADKDYGEILGMIIPYAKKFFCLTPQSDRALSADALAAYLGTQGMEAHACKTTAEAIDRAKKALSDDDFIVCFGSLYLAGDIRKTVLDR